MGNGGKGSSIDLRDKVIGMSYCLWGSQGRVQGPLNRREERQGEGGQGEREEAELDRQRRVPGRERLGTATSELCCSVVPRGLRLPPTLWAR